ncbi:hypothetical protein [Corynebacterium sp.]|uniref:hypothetical protein n=1 Tax=Corynebacterium sp. TaxID=1720 RepID=UPI0026E09CE5|nr:hypothetical protein [Corynebacterium sp.]MDO5513445.1 hypothetical protein [Corynebacterium sp.]
MREEMRTSPPSVLVCLCASMLWSGLSFFGLAGWLGDSALMWSLAPALVGGLLTPWSTVRRQGIAMMFGPAVLAVTYVVVLIWVAILAISWSAVRP